MPAPEEPPRASTETRRRFETSSARTVPIEYTRLEELDDRLHKPLHLPRLPRLPRPPIRKMLSKILWLIPARVKNSRGVHLAGRHPGISAWVVIFAGVIVVVSTYYIRTPGIDDPRYKQWMQSRGTDAVQAALAEIGPGIPEPRVEAVPMEGRTIGWYQGTSHTVAFTTTRDLFDFEVLNVAAHESVHAIFHKEHLQPYSETRGDFFNLVNETTAYVLGAYIAGDAWSKQDKDGRVLSAYLVQIYRNGCDPDVPDNTYNYYLAPGRPSSGDFERDQWYGALIHFGPTRLVDAIDLICCQNPDPTEAARAIAKRFMRTDLELRDLPILEEFERTKNRWK